MNAAIPVGERVKFYRSASRRTQVSLAGKTGISVVYLSQIETGARMPSMPVLWRLASVLGISISALVAEPITTAAEPSPWAAALASAMIDLSPGELAQAPDLTGLRERNDAVTMAWRTSQHRFSETGAMLPGLVRETIAATRYRWTPAEAEQRREAHRIAAEVYETVRHFAREIGRPDLGLIASERQISHADQADDPIRRALGRWSSAQAVAATGDPGDVERIALAALEDLKPETGREGERRVDALSLSGMLMMMAALAAGRQGDHWTGLNRLRDQAGVLADQLGERGVGPFRLSFGPSNVLIWTAAVLVEAGESAEALRVTDQIDMTQVASIERRATAILQAAQANHQRGEDAATMLLLLRLERVAPEDILHRGVAHELVRGLLHRARPTMAGEVRELAGRMGMFA